MPFEVGIWAVRSALGGQFVGSRCACAQLPLMHASFVQASPHVAGVSSGMWF
jgi:hypothetical protein